MCDSTPFRLHALHSSSLCCAASPFRSGVRPEQALWRPDRGPRKALHSLSHLQGKASPTKFRLSRCGNVWSLCGMLQFSLCWIMRHKLNWSTLTENTSLSSERHEISPSVSGSSPSCHLGHALQARLSYWLQPYIALECILDWIGTGACLATLSVRVEPSTTYRRGWWFGIQNALKVLNSVSFWKAFTLESRWYDF